MIDDNRITYAQKFLQELIKERKLADWCSENDIPHASIYRIAMGETAVTYKTMANLAHLIPVIDWLFYTDEEIPYERKLTAKWDWNQPSKIIKKHKYDWKKIAKKYDIDELPAYNIFSISRTKPSPDLIRLFCKNTDPIEFFINGEVSSYYPKIYDQIKVGTKNYVVIHSDEKKQIFTACEITEVDFLNIKTFEFSNCYPIYINTLTSEEYDRIKSKILDFLN